MRKSSRTVSFALSIIFLLMITNATAGGLFDVVNPAPLPLNDSASGYFTDDYQVNYFLLSASSDGQYALSHTGSSGDLFVRVYAAEPTAGGGVNIIPYLSAPTVSHYALKAGMYKISVFNQRSVKSYTISNTYAPPTFSADPEPNDEFVQAAPLLMSGDVFGHQGYAFDAYGGMPVYNNSDTMDTWKITTDEDGYFIVDSALAETLDFNLYLYGEDEKLMLSYSESDTYSNLEHQLAAGTYYVKTNYSTGFGSYMLTSSIQGAFLENDPEPNDVINSATALPVGGEDTGHIGFATDAASATLTGYYRIYDTKDYWKITTEEDGVLQIATTSNVDFDDGPFMHLYIFSEDGVLMQSNYNYDELLNVETSIEVAAGTYYVLTEHEAGYGSYLIACGLTPATLANDIETNDISDEATLLLDSGEGEGAATGHLGFMTDAKSGLNGPYNIYDTFDYWKIEYDSDGLLDLTVHLEGDSDDPLKIYFEVFNEFYNASGSGLHSDFYSSKVDFSATFPREAGYIYVSVRRVSGFGSYTLSYTHTAAALAADDLVNDIMDDASIIPIGGVATGHLGFPKKAQDYNDYWRIDVLEEGTLEITCVSEGEFDEGPVMYLSLHQDTPWLASDMNYDYGDSSYISYDVTPGTYYVNVHYREGYGSYTLTVSKPGDAVTILTKTLPIATIGEEYSYAVELDYAGDETLSYELLTSPQWLSISDEGILEGTPKDSDSGSDIAVTIKVFTSKSEDTLETSISVGAALDVAENILPNAFTVGSPFPNPFNAETTISYSLPHAADVQISVFNLLGQIVFNETFANMSPGYKSFVWHGSESGGNPLNSGVYFIKIASENNSYIKKALYIK